MLFLILLSESNYCVSFELDFCLFVLVYLITAHDYTEATYKYTVPELVAELQARISSSVESKAFEIDILAAVVSTSL
jgi:hypothetical protein